MYREKTVGVVVPAYNEELLIAETLTTMPDFVDRIFVVEDGSKDRTLEVVEGLAKKDSRITIVVHEANQGLGQSLIDGYVASRDAGMDVTAVMAGDAQMAPGDLPAVLDPVVSGGSDYCKGNRLLREDVTELMPTYRYLGNSVLTLLTKFATGYWHIIDPQCGYTAISLMALKGIPIEKMIKGYGYNAHVLNMLNLKNFTVCDVEVQPVYGRETSGIKLGSYIVNVSKLLLRLFIRRMVYKYVVREFHPLIFFYLMSFMLGCFSLPLFVWFCYVFLGLGLDPSSTPVVLTFSITMSFFAFFFAMWLDMEDNRKLIGRKE